MNRVKGLRYDAESDRFLVTVEPGLPLTELRRGLLSKEFETAGWTPNSLNALTTLRARGNYFFPPDPTETTATVGGMISCNASGACSFRYGPTRHYIQALRLLFFDDSTLTLRRGQEKATGRNFVLTTDQGRRIAGTMPTYSLPDVKNAAGYYVADHMDLIDLFIGAEGTLGILTEAEIALIRSPAFRWGVTAFFPSEDGALAFVRRIRGQAKYRPAAMEFFDRRALNLLREKKPVYSFLSGIPALPPSYHTAIYVEYHGDDEDWMSSAVESLSDFMTQCGGDESGTWTAMTPQEMQKLHDFRHAVPETVNAVIDERRQKDPSLTKLGTDMAAPDAALEQVMALYRRTLDRSGLEYVVFGHIGDNHVHVNILPHSSEEYEQGRKLYLEWAREVIRMGGTVSAEHGIGKLKTALLAEMYGPAGIEQMRALKRLFDSSFRLNRGNLFSAAG